VHYTGNMSRAFTKEPDGTEVFDDLPERPIGGEINFVTPHGYELIEAEIARLRTVLARAQAESARAAIGEASRDLRYWSARLASAEVVPLPTEMSEVRFGHKVTIRRKDGRDQTYQIVGVDEADPKKGLISYISPLAEALIGGRVGEEIEAGPISAKIVKIATN
jgi:transcription elongation GreA/GreB family factor